MDAPHPARIRTWLIVGAALAVLGIALGAWISIGRGNDPFAVDAAWSAWLAAGRTEILLSFSYAMNFLGGGWFGILALPLAVVAVLLVLRRPWAAAYFLVASAVSAGLVQVCKHLFGRARPEEIIVVSDFGSFPSGHVANAATIAVALFVVFPGVWVAIAGAAWTTLMAFSRTYLGAHWLSDTLGGALLGAGSALLVAVLFARLLDSEFRRRAGSRPVAEVAS
ncbi:phosphatase PAP2 family protein [Microbacterium limosum]|uniref:Phosphatase PAP2 family protein n=1 Tax=Microbacterium limosum TaxID=3079935 RepID=A0AAU0MJ59_9MICO|nr:phosphatase PAP2 family protein [Microbacterium sp. Y20]WOQ70194.1 phosphatase PAP2 family protein [Microbacterium sp. Y20]